MKHGLIIFIRNPILGEVKTRLANTMGNEKALCIYHKLLNHTQQVTKNLSCDKFVFYSDRVDRHDQWEESIYKKKLQQPGDLGTRMAGAFHHLFNEGYKHLVIIGSDCLELNESIIADAFETLDRHHVVIGPSSDGGYYLLGMNAYLPTLFENKLWGSSSVFRETLRDLSTAGASVKILVMLNDIDEEKDLPVSFL